MKEKRKEGRERKKRRERKGKNRREEVKNGERQKWRKVRREHDGLLGKKKKICNGNEGTLFASRKKLCLSPWL